MELDNLFEFYSEKKSDCLRYLAKYGSFFYTNGISHSILAHI